MSKCNKNQELITSLNSRCTIHYFRLRILPMKMNRKIWRKSVDSCIDKSAFFLGEKHFVLPW